LELTEDVGHFSSYTKPENEAGYHCETDQ